MTEEASEWFRVAFEDSYLTVYRHRSDEDAALEASWASSVTGLARDARVLDLCCGNGRHAAALVREAPERRVIGLDLSRVLLSEALSRGELSCCVRADMRVLPFRDGTFDAVFQFFTSFGYFADEAEDAAVLAGIARVLRPGGSVFIDFLNAQRVRDALVPRSEERRDGMRIVQQRRITAAGTRVEKTVEVTPPDGKVIRYRESVRLWERGDIQEMGTAAGLRLDRVFGDFGGAPFGPESPRLVLVGTRV